MNLRELENQFLKSIDIEKVTDKLNSNWIQLIDNIENADIKTELLSIAKKRI